MLISVGGFKSSVYPSLICLCVSPKTNWVVKLSKHLLVLPSVQSACHCLSWRLVCQGREVMTPQLQTFQPKTGV